jgi:hypothetical protein
LNSSNKTMREAPKKLAVVENINNESARKIVKAAVASSKATNLTSNQASTEIKTMKTVNK